MIEKAKEKGVSVKRKIFEKTLRMFKRKYITFL